MKVILKQDVDQVGRAGDIVEVADGFGRNYLIPKGLAIRATAGSLAQIEHRKRMVEAGIARARKAAVALKERLEGISCRIAREAGEEDKLFGSVTARDIATALAEEGIHVDHRAIQLEKPIKHLGIFPVQIKLARDVVATVRVWVVAKD